VGRTSSSGPTRSRLAAHRILTAVERGRRLDRALDASGLSGPDRAWAHHLTFGVCRLRGRLDHLLDRAVTRGLDSVRSEVVIVLRMGAFQLGYMSGVPDYAAVAESVALARAVAGGGAASLVNAVLRALQRSGLGEDRFPSRIDRPVDYLQTWGSHPRWLVERWLERWPSHDVETLVDLDNREPELFVRPLDGDVASALAKLRRAEVDGEAVGCGTGCVRIIDGTGPVKALEIVDGFVQDPGAALVTRYADLPKRGIVVDLCAAPGGKSLAAVAPGRTVIASDLSEVRMRVMQDHVRRAGVVGLELLVARAEQAPFRPVDVILVDVPCTGTGTLRRHPDARWRLRPHSVERMVTIQRRILTAAAELVTQGGLLVYSTCSLETEENEGQVDWFLAGRPEFSLESTRAVVPEFLDKRGCLTVLPHQSGFDGAFAARFRRRS
jgi:16S rRNA (cytosine967-C5)-methyltransferase